MRRLKNAIALATKAHDGQNRKFTGKPYITHPKEVCEYFASIPSANYGCMGMTTYEDMCCACWLHDVIEDCPQISKEEIVQACGERVLKLVEELTNASTGSKEKRAIRKKMDLEHLKGVSREAKLIKLIDRICNLRDMMGADKGFLRLYTNESKDLLDTLKGTSPYLENILQKEINKLEEYLMT